MEKILGTTIVLLGAAALSATAATVQIDLSGYDSGSDVNSSFQAYRGDPSAMANHLNEWLANSSGWCGSKANTSSETSSYFKSAVGSEDGSVTVTYTNRRGYGGSGVGLKVSLDAAGYSADAFSSLTFTVDLATSTGGTYRVYLAYQTENGWQAVESQATSGTITVTADLSGNKLTSENVYVFVESNPGRQINHRTVSAWRPSFFFYWRGITECNVPGIEYSRLWKEKLPGKLFFAMLQVYSSK